jgi:hypothetical protein
MIATAHHENDDLWAIAAGFAIGAVALSGAIVLVHQPAAQALVERMAGFVSQQVQGAYPHLSPAR